MHSSAQTFASSSVYVNNLEHSHFLLCRGGKRRRGGVQRQRVWAFRTILQRAHALLPSDTACLASSPGKTRRTAVVISGFERVPFLL